MPDAPLLIASRSWERIERVFAPLFEARDADTGHPVRVILAALIRARREYTYEIDAASLMLTNEQWIPIEGVHELPLIDTLIAQHRRFVKPLRYDARSAAAFPNALLLDAGPAPVPLHGECFHGYEGAAFQRKGNCGNRCAGRLGLEDRGTNAGLQTRYSAGAAVLIRAIEA